MSNYCLCWLYEPNHGQLSFKALDPTSTNTDQSTLPSTLTHDRVIGCVQDYITALILNDNLALENVLEMTRSGALLWLMSESVTP